MNEKRELIAGEQLATLAKQGQVWKFVEESFTFRRPAPLFDRPLEITIQMLRGLRMVDETIVVHGSLPREKGDES